MSTVATARRALRAPVVALHILAGLIYAVLFVRPRLGRVISTRPLAVWSRILCRLIGVRVETRGAIAPGATLFVANHISWLDIFCIAAVCPTHFLAKSEVAAWPLFGWMARRVGTAFIRRGGESGASEATEQLVWRLHQGSRMVIFPEGTSTTGEAVKRFHPRLFQAAIHARCPVQAIALRYPARDGINRMVPFIGDDDFLVHLWRLLGERNVIAELCFCEPVPATGQTRDSLARQTHEQITAVLRQPAQAPLRRRYRLPFKRLGTRRSGYFRR